MSEGQARGAGVLQVLPGCLPQVLILNPSVLAQSCQEKWPALLEEGEEGLGIRDDLVQGPGREDRLGDQDLNQPRRQRGR